MLSEYTLLGCLGNNCHIVLNGIIGNYPYLLLLISRLLVEYQEDGEKSNKKISWEKQVEEKWFYEEEISYIEHQVDSKITVDKVTTFTYKEWLPGKTFYERDLS